MGRNQQAGHAATSWFGSARWVTVGQRRWRLNVRRARDWAELEAWFYRRHPVPLDGGHRPGQRSGATEGCDREIRLGAVWIGRFVQWLDSPHGWAACWWQSVRNHEPQCTLKWLRQWIASLKPPARRVVRRLVAATDGLPELDVGNVCGRSSASVKRSIALCGLRGIGCRTSWRSATLGRLGKWVI